jgi:hypothetical protein
VPLAGGELIGSDSSDEELEEELEESPDSLIERNWETNDRRFSDSFH